MAAQPEQDRPVRVVMAVANDVSTDTRVQKTALSLARVGLDVVVLGYTAGTRREELELGPVRLIRVPVPWRLRDRRTAVRASRRKRRLHLGPGKEAEAAAKLRLQARAKDTALMPRPLALAQLSWITGARRLVHLSAGLERKAQRWQTRRWTEWDEASVVSDRRTPWRRWLPEIDDYEMVFAPVLDELAPDVIHAHDVHDMGIAARAVARARRRGRRVTWVYDAHELVSGLSQYGGRTKRVVAAYADLEREYVQAAAGVLTVSDALADELVQRYRLRERPAVVMNTPPAAALAVHEGPAGDEGGSDEPSRAGIRAAAGVPEGVPLLVYSGGVQHARGVHTAVEALVELPEAHLAVVCVPSPTTWAVKQVLSKAAELGVADRVHALPPVPPAEVATFLRTADVGLIPLLHFGSHEVALPNKLFEYLHAGLPLVVSDCRAQAAFVRDLGVGEVHRAEDAADLARAVRAVLADPDRYLAPLRADEHLLDPWSWEHQEERLWGFYRQVLGPRALTDPQPAPVVPSLLPRSAPPAAKARSAAAPAASGLVLRSTKRADRPVVGIGPANMAGQGWAWGKALERARPDVRVEVVQIDRGSPLLFPADVTVPAAAFARDQDWQRAWAEHGLATWTHALLEAGRPLLGTANGPDFSGDVPVLRAAGVQVGLLFHGSEIRDPRRHALAYPFSPFQDPDDELTARLQRQVEQLRPLVEAFDGPSFVSTPDLLDDVPGATWLPVTVRTDVPQGETPLTRPVPLVVHAPSRRALKGTALIEPVLEKLAADGLLEYRRIEGTPPERMPELLAAADVVIDHVGIGNYGVLTCEAMAAGRVTLSHVHERVRARVGEDLPVIEITPQTLAETLERVCAERDWARSVAAQGPGFVARHHDGRRAGEVLSRFVGPTGD